MAVGDIYEVIDVQEFEGQEVQNVYFYEQRAAFVPLFGNIAYNVGAEWNETILPEIVNVQNTEIMHIETRVRNLFDATDASTVVSGVPGNQGSTSDALPTFNAYGLTLLTDNASIRPGAKRLAGVSEDAQTDGVPTPTILGFLEVIAEALAAPLAGGLIIASDIMFPVVVKRVREGAEGAYEYRLPETSGEAIVGRIVEVLVKMLVTSQISRKIGTGV